MQKKGAFASLTPGSSKQRSTSQKTASRSFQSGTLTYTRSKAVLFPVVARFCQYQKSSQAERRADLTRKVLLLELPLC